MSQPNMRKSYSFFLSTIVYTLLLSITNIALAQEGESGMDAALAKVDAVFGKYLVGPIASVLFF